MAGIVEKIKKNPVLITALLLSLLPLAAGSLLCFFDGKTILDVYLPVSEWNDEIIYYKQVEAVVHYGIPQGFFGYDESRAMHLSFGTWNPLLLLPFVLWGLVFGWNLLSPVLCNLALMMLAVFFFVLLTKPNRKQTVALAALYLTSMFTTRYMLSTMAETILIFYAVLFLGLCISYQEEEKNYKLVLSYILVVLMALGRPYLLVFILLPAYFFFRKNKVWAVLATLAVMAGTAALYFVITANFCAPYFIDSIKTYWIEQYRLAGLWEGIKYTVKEFLKGASEFLELSIAGVRGDTERSGLALQFLIIFLVVSVQTAADAFQKRKKEFLLHGFLTGSFLVVLTALFLMYQLMAGSRHFVVFITMGVFVISRMDGRWYGRLLVTGLLLSLVYIRVPEDLLYCELPYKDKAVQQEVSGLSEMLEENMVMSQEEIPSFDNVVVWTFNDNVNGTDTQMRWQLLYAVPAGYGINCCSGGYVQNNLETLKSRYLAVPAGGELDARCLESGKSEVARTENIVVFDMKALEPAADF